MSPRRRFAAALAAALVGAFVLVATGACSDGGSEDAAPTTSSAPTGSTGASATSPDGTDGPTDADCPTRAPERLAATVVSTVPHDPTVYTQGLLVHDGVVYESGGRYGESSLRALDLATGQETSEVTLPDEVFGEGLAVAGDELVQLTWKEGIAYRWDLAELLGGDPQPLGTFDYEGEGWGLTTLADDTLVMSDGSDELVVRDPEDFTVLATHRVTRSDGDADELNELEFDGESIWANRYRTDELLRIDPTCWDVTGVVDLGGLRRAAGTVAEDAGDDIDVTNGIAVLPGTDEFLVTGKWWPTMYRVTIAPDE